MIEPKRIQRRRTKGWRMPEGAIYVGRPTRWGNPWTMYAGGKFLDGSPIPMAWILGMYRRTVETRTWSDPEHLEPLRGQDLVCWCPLDLPCHADVLLELANSRG